MSPAQRRLAALIAAFAPARAGRLVALVSTSTSDVVREHASWLASCPRKERLKALASALSSARIAGTADLGACHPLWQRLAREAMAQGSPPSAPRTGVQRQDHTVRPRCELARKDSASASGTLHEFTDQR